MKEYNEIMNELESRFRQCPETPQSLSKENIVNKIKKENTVQEKKKSFAWGAEAIAAVFAVIIVLAVVLGEQGFFKAPVENLNDIHQEIQSENDKNIDLKNENVTPLPEGVYKFENTEEIQKRFKKLYKENNGKGFFGYVFNYAEDMVIGADGVKAESAVVPTTAAAALNAPTGSTPNNSPEFGNTNVQTVGVDEGDILKNDGRYIYITSSYGSDTAKVKIIDTETMEHITTIDIGKKTEVHVEEFYVTGDILTIIYTEDTDSSNYFGSGDETKADVYDISDKKAPKKVNTHSQNGGFRNSRKIGDILYTISCYRVVAEDEKQAVENAVPSVNGEKIRCDCIYHFEDDSTTYTVITALDTTKAEKATSVAVLGDTSEIYCSQNTIYLLNTIFEAQTEKTVITSFNLKGTEILCKAKGEVKGYFKDNYSFDEYEGYLRAATIYYDFTTYKQVNKVYVLNENLEVVGESENLNDEEEIKAVRFMGKKGYVVTFRQTDPLYALDLSDPKSPKMTGELKLPGYSTYLHPISDNVLMGIGYDGDEENAKINNLKIALFDISDMTKPSLLDEFVIINSSSDVNYEPKALIHYPLKSIIGIPVISYSTGTTEVKSFAVIKYTDNKLSEVKGFIHDSDIYARSFRGTYIGELLYTIDDYKIIEHRLSTGEKLREAMIVTQTEIDAPKTTAVYVTEPAFFN